MQRDNPQVYPAEVSIKPAESPRGAVFLDRDGTIIEDRGHLSDPEEVHLLPNTVEALQNLQEQYLLFVVSNQSGVAKGLITLDDVQRINQHLADLLMQNGIFIKEWYVCPHSRPDNCECIKPNPYFLHRAADQYGISLPHSFVIGDHPHDVITADNAGATGLYVRTGHGSHHLDELSAGQLVFEDIGEAAGWILRNSSN